MRFKKTLSLAMNYFNCLILFICWSQRNTAMGLLTCLCVVVLIAAPALQEGVSPPQISPLSSVAKSIEKSIKTPLVTKKEKHHKTTEPCPNITNPVPCYSISHKNYDIKINESTPCVVKCSYNPQEVRMWLDDVLGIVTYTCSHSSFIVNSVHNC